MPTFQLVVVTPSQTVFDGEVNRITARTISGDIGILSGHANYVAPLAIGALEIATDDTKKIAAIAGGIIKVDKGKTTILTNACEWSTEIDVDRAKKALENAKVILNNSDEKDDSVEMANLKLRRALNRIDIASKK